MMQPTLLNMQSNSQSSEKYLHATTTRRVFFSLTRAEVEDPESKQVNKMRIVEPLHKISLYKQAFSTGESFKLLVRERVCCCTSCLDNNFGGCELQVKYI